MVSSYVPRSFFLVFFFFFLIEYFFLVIAMLYFYETFGAYKTIYLWLQLIVA